MRSLRDNQQDKMITKLKIKYSVKVEDHLTKDNNKVTIKSFKDKVSTDSGETPTNDD